MQTWPQYGAGPEDRPTPEKLRAWQRLQLPPSHEVGVTVPLDLVIGRADQVAVVLSDVRVHSTGLVLTVSARGTVSLVPSAAGFAQAMHHTPGDGQADARLMLGFEFTDGRRASNLLPRLPPGEAANDQQPTLVLLSGNGATERYDSRWWLRPLPPTGPVRVVCAWPVHDLPETVTELDGGQLQGAVGQVQVLWEPVDVPAPQPPQHSLPPSGWFSASSG